MTQQVAKPGWMSSLTKPLAVVILFLGIPFALCLDTALLQVFVSLRYNDFGKFYYSARALLAGADMYGQSPSTFNEALNRHVWNMNPPHFHFLLTPLAVLPLTLAFVGWAILNVAGLVMSAVIIHREIGPVRLSVPAVSLVVFCALVWVPTGSILLTGQLPWLLLLPLTLSWRAARRDNWGAAGAWCGLCVSVKPFLLVFLGYFLITRKWRALAASAAIIAAAFVVGLSTLGWQQHLAWLAALRAVDWSWATMNGSILGILNRCFVASPIYYPIGHLTGWVTPIWVLGIGLVVWLSIRQGFLAQSVDRQYAVALLAGQLISPLGWVYYLWLAAGPLVGLWRQSGTIPLLARAGIATLIFPLFLALLGQPSGVATLTVGSTCFWGTALLWLSALRWPSIPDVAAQTSFPAGGMGSGA